MKNRLWVAVVFLFTIAPVLLNAQSYQPMHLGMSNWNFGAGPNGLSFNRTTYAPSITTTKSALGIGGAATASDPNNGNLLFYTDGSRVYDASHSLMPSGSGLSGNPTSNQPAVVCPVPGQPNKYFIFANSATKTAGGSITYDIVDLTLFGNSIFPSVVPLGDLEGPFHSSMGLTGRAEAMTVVPHANGTDYWLITQSANSQDYSATLINAATYTPTHAGVFNTTTTSGLGLTMSASQFAYHAGLKKLAVAPTTASQNVIILDFNDNSGGFTPAIESPIQNSASAGASNQSIYDVEWSGDGRFVYYSVFGDTGIPGNVFQFDRQNPGLTLPSVLPATVYRSYGLQLAPDSSIYHLYQNTSTGPYLMGRISDPDSVASRVSYQANPFTVANWNATQFSATLPRIKPVITVTFTSAGNCQNSPTSFYPTVTPYADSLIWNFGDGNGMNTWSPIYTYPDAGTFTVSVTAFANGQPQLPPTTSSITIRAFPITLTLVSDTTACTFEFPPPKGTSGPPPFSVTVTAQGGTPTYLWSNGDIGATLTPDSAGYYYVVASNGSGCSAYAGVNVNEYGVQDQRANVWYFGNKAGIDFTPQPPIALSDGAMNAPEGCSAISDRNGKIIFYTDGDNVYDKSHALIASNIGGDSTSTQSALIVPVPGDETLYYIFTTEAKEDYPSNTVYYSLFDLKQNNGDGAIVQQKIPLYSKSTERLASNGNWLITHEYGNNSFWCFQITSIGIGQPVITSIGSDHAFTNPSLTEGYMKMGPTGNIAVALGAPGAGNRLEVFDFDNTTGVLSNFRQLNLNETGGQIYGVEFSPGGNKLFATVKGEPTPSFIYEYSIDSLSQLHFKQKVTEALELGALQIGPDGQIYMAINGSSSLGLILANEDTTQLSTFNMAGFALAGGTNSTLGLPSFAQSTGSPSSTPGMSVAGFCFGSPMLFSATPSDPYIDTFLWGFGDGSSSDEQSGEHNYAAAGAYTVSVIINNRCLIHDGTPPFTFSENVNIVNPPAPPTIPATSAICIDPVVLNANATNVTGLTYAWNTGATTQQISVGTPGIYTVTLTDATGCTSSGETTIDDGRPVVDFGPDVTICEGQSVSNLDAGNPAPAFTHAWTLNGVLNGNTGSTQSVNANTPARLVYRDTVINVATGCRAIEDIVITINESPNLALTAFGTTACQTPTGSIRLVIQPLTQTIQPPTHTFSYFVVGGVSTFVEGQNPGTYTVPSLTGGTYSVLLSDEITGCAVSNTVTVNDQLNTLSAPGLTTCTESPIVATTDAATNPSAGNFRYTVFDTFGTQVDTKNNINASPFSTRPLPPGTYTLQVTRNNCVTGVNNIVITQGAQTAPFTVTPDMCAASPTITGPAGLNYNWTGLTATSTNIIVAPTQTTEQLVLERRAGAYRYSVTADDGVLCPTTQTISVTIEAPITPRINPFDPCLDPTTLSASPATGDYTYLWYKNGTIDPTLAGSSIALGVTGTTDDYEVEIISGATGCSYRSSPATSVRVIGPFTVALNSTPVCDDGKPFEISVATDAADPTFKWFRNTGAGFVSLSETTPTISQSVNGIYKVEVTDGPCKAENTVQLLRAPLPVGSMPETVIICDDPENVDPETDNYDLNPGTFASYDWFIRKTPDSPETSLNYTDQIYTVEKKGIYRVEITNTWGCKSDVITDVLNDCVPKIYAPTAFRPASSVPANKNFFAKTFFITDDFKVFVYNRWGELIFQSNDRYFEWNGGYNNDAGNPLPSGAYAYIIQYVSAFRPDQGVQEKRGGVMLVR